MAEPARNRVTPMGEIVAAPLRGAWTGNRGILHEDREVVRFHASDLWITCALRFKDRWSEQWRPHHFTWLYFHDEAVAFAAGHRPCGECRRAEYVAYRDAWADALDVRAPSARDMNRRLHLERIHRGTHVRRLHEVGWRELPAGAFVRLEDAPVLLLDDEFAAEIANATMHGVMHLGWVPDGDGGHRGQMAVLVKPNGLLGEAYMAAIRPFRHLVVYPAMMQQIERRWERRDPGRLTAA